MFRQNRCLYFHMHLVKSYKFEITNRQINYIYLCVLYNYDFYFYNLFMVQYICPYLVYNYYCAEYEK